MKYCPHCKEPVDIQSGACPHCKFDVDAPPEQIKELRSFYSALTGESISDTTPLPDAARDLNIGLSLEAFEALHPGSLGVKDYIDEREDPFGGLIPVPDCREKESFESRATEPGGAFEPHDGGVPVFDVDAEGSGEHPSSGEQEITLKAKKVPKREVGEPDAEEREPALNGAGAVLGRIIAQPGAPGKYPGAVDEVNVHELITPPPETPSPPPAKESGASAGEELSGDAKPQLTQAVSILANLAQQLKTDTVETGQEPSSTSVSRERSDEVEQAGVAKATPLKGRKRARKMARHVGLIDAALFGSKIKKDPAAKALFAAGRRSGLLKAAREVQKMLECDEVTLEDLYDLEDRFHGMAYPKSLEKSKK